MPFESTLRDYREAAAAFSRPARLFLLCTTLAWTGYGVPYVAGGLHPINAFIILGFLSSITYREWRGERAAAAEPAAA